MAVVDDTTAGTPPETSSEADVARARALLEHARRIVVLTGAGISTDSGIQDFRGPNGVWTKNPEAEKTMTLQTYMADPEHRRRAWQNRLTSTLWDAEPNAGHRALVDLERSGRLDTLVTQNIDGLHQKAGTDPALVVEIHGTTRDVIEVQLDLDGYPVTVIDTAGIRDTVDPVELEGVRRARSRAAEADLVLWVTDTEHLQNEEEFVPAAAALWKVRNKIDLGTSDDGAKAGQGQGPAFKISARQGDGIAGLVTALTSFARDYFGSSEDGLIGRERQRRLLQESADGLRRALALAAQGDELIAEELRAASQSLGRLVGRVDVEDILDKIFREFCIGK